MPEEMTTNEEVTTEAESAPVEEEVFFDANKVLPEHRASFVEMQKAFTQKTQEIAPMRKLAETYGGVESLEDFLTQFDTADGVLNWWTAVAGEMGVPEEKLVALFSEEQEATTTPSVATKEGSEQTPSYVTQDQIDQMFREFMAEQEEKTRSSAEDQTVKDFMSKLPLKDDRARRLVAQLAAEYPMHLGYESRIQKGFEDYKQLVAESAQTAQEAQTTANAAAPQTLGGTTPLEASESPAKNRMDARHAALEYLEAREKANE